MDTTAKEEYQREIQVSLEEVNRLLEVGQLLFSVLTSEEIEELQKLLSSNNKIGNTGDS
ncbi:MAG: hypothetical protein IIC78_06585 [Chloroflexi bacterium]|nr:hypothetical protein [Chloroflexota bacterium]